MIQSQSTNTGTFRALSRPLLAAGHRVIVTGALLLTLVTAAPAQAQECPATWVPGFGTTGTNADVRAFAVLPGGNIIVGGQFTTAGGVAASGIARYSPATNLWSALSTAFAVSDVTSLAMLPGGDLIVGGAFSSTNILRYNPSTDTWSAMGFGTSNRVNALAVLPSGDVIVGGDFSWAGSFSPLRNYIARYNPTTNVWSGVGPLNGTSSGTGGSVYALAVLPSGDVMVGGRFNSAGNVVGTNNIARYNPTTNQWATVGTGVSGTVNFEPARVNAMAVLPSGDLIVGGNFSTAGGVAALGIARYSPASGIWSALGSGANPVEALAVLPGGDVIVGGGFLTAGGAAASTIARVNPTTGVWTALGSGVSGVSGALFQTRALAVLPGAGDNVIVGGLFSNAGGLVASNIARCSFGSAAPSIISQPLPVVTAPSASAFFGITAGGGSGTFTYQWRQGGVALSTISNPSAATSVLSLTNVQAANVGSYDCLVTNSCGGASTLSSPATLSLLSQPSCTSSFAAAVNYGSDGATSVAVGDFNGDGRPDLAVSGGNSVSVHLGSGNGTFAPRVSYPTGNFCSSVAIGDFNGDGKLDLATANAAFAGTMSVLLGNGDGTFAPAVNYTADRNAVSVAVGDFNSDGKPDLAAANAGSNNVSVFMGNGNGTFAAAVNYAAGTSPSTVAIGDLNGDGRPDLAVSNSSSNNVSVLLGNGNGTFAPRVDYAAGANTPCVTIGDLNGDGKLDLATTNGGISGTVSVFMGNGNGTFAPKVSYPVGTSPSSVAIGDLNGDGRLDLAVANGGNFTLSVLLGDGSGGFAAPVSYTTGTSSSGIAISDLNGDGKPDLAVSNSGDSNVSVLMNTGPSVGFSQQPQSQSVLPGASVVFTATATGTGPFTYQWRRNGLPIINATTTTLSVSNVSDAKTGVYDVQVRGGCNSTTVTTSLPAILSIDTAGIPGCLADLVGGGDDGLTPDGTIDGNDFIAFINAFAAGC